MSTVARRFSATPQRTAGMTWEAIAILICGNDSMAKKEFEAVRGLAAASIAEEAFRKNPLVVTGVGPRLRVYCLYGEEAATGDNCNETALTWKPTDGEWKAYLPCLQEDFLWMDREIRSCSTQITVYDIEKGLPEAVRESDDSQALSLSSNQQLAVDQERFKSL